MARVVKEKASQDFSRIVKGTEKTRKKLGVLEELFTYWNLEDADDELEELEDIKLYDEAKKSSEPSIPIDEAFKMIETLRTAE